MRDLFTEVLQTQFPFVYAKPKVDEKKLYTKASVIPQGDGRYRASISFFMDGNTYSVTDVVDTIEAAESFLKEQANRADPFN